MDDIKEGDEENSNIPVEMVNVPISFNVAGQQKFKLIVPLKAHDHAVSDDKEHAVHLSFRGPHGNTFGERITFNVLIETANVNQFDEMQLYQLALKLHNELKLGSFDECVEAARTNKCDEAKTVIYLQQR